MASEKKPNRSPSEMASPGPIYCGVDVGASTTKIVIVDEGGTIVGADVCKSGVDYQAAARTGLEATLAAAWLGEERICATFATGYGRRNVDFAGETRTEIACHGAGCYHYFPHPITIVDIGGQDNKIIRLDKSGKRLSFKMNRKCAAGTGAFLEEIAVRLDLDIGDLDRLASSAEKTVHLSSFCTVFAKTEILSHIRRGESPGDIVKGAFQSVVNRVLEMETFEGAVVLTGGVAAHNSIVAQLMGAALEREVLVPPEPQITGALGAALLARENNR